MQPADIQHMQEDAHSCQQPFRTERHLSGQDLALVLPSRNAGQEIPPLAYESIGAALVHHCCKQYAGRPAFICMGKTMTYAELDWPLAPRSRAWLQAKGSQKGDRVAVMMPNVLQYPVVTSAASCAPASPSSTSTRSTRRANSSTSCKDSGATAHLRAGELRPHRAAGHRPDRARAPSSSRRWATCSASRATSSISSSARSRSWCRPGRCPAHTPFKPMLAGGRRLPLKPVTVSRERHRLPAIYRRHDRRLQGRDADATATLLSNVEQVQHLAGLPPTVEQAARRATVLYVCALPLYHIFALTVNSLMGMLGAAP